jgi:hypothetical protein
MSRREWRCRNRECLVPDGAILGRLTCDGGLVLDSGVREFRCYFDSQRALVTCPECGTKREFRGGAFLGWDVIRGDAG